jgi:hypothetical protein
MSKQFLRALTFMLLLLPLTGMAAPRIFYTDIVTGPNTGGENNNGAYLTLFGSGFGATQDASQVTINNVPVAAYKQWSDAKITVLPGARVTSGAIQVTVSGQPSNTDNSFSVVPGKIFFVALTGNDSTGVIGNINQPFRTIQTVLDRSDFGAGDHLIVRGGTWTDVFSFYGSFFSIYGKGGTAGAPLVIMGYPGETALFSRTTQTRGFHTYNTPGYYVIANLHLDAGGSSPCYPLGASTACGLGISLGVGTVGVRIVNNEVLNFFEDSGGAATIDGSGKNFRILGNKLHNNGGSKLYHGIYIDGRDTSGPDDIEIAYNHVSYQVGGRGIQIYGDTGTLINNVRIHHNLVHNIHLDGIIISRDTGTGFQIYNNVVYHTGDNTLQGPSTDPGGTGGCVRFAGPQTVAEVYNNTFMDCAVDQQPDSAGLRFENFTQLTLRNNILENSPGVIILSTVGIDPARLMAATTASNNLWVNTAGTLPPAYIGAVPGDPMFVSASVNNYRLAPGTNNAAIDHGSSVINTVVTTDFDGNVRPQGGGYDIGAFESSGITLATPQNMRITKK